MKCDVCSADVIELRRGRCWGCYNRWVENRPVGMGARCCICGERRREFLRTTELLGGWWPTCYSCSGRVHALETIPPSIAEIRELLDRERRGKLVERRTGQPDTRVFRYERRRDERRQAREQRVPSWPSLYDDVPSTATPELTARSPAIPAGMTPLAEGTDPGSKSPLAFADDLDDLALNEIAMEIAGTGDFDPDLTCIRDLGWTESQAARPLDGTIDLLDI